jgi:Fe-S cluster assembly ATP-binding protein
LNQLEIKNLHVSVEGKEILRGVDLVVPVGEIHAVMGPNGSGKSTLASTILGHPKYEPTQGEILWKGQNLLELETDVRAKSGLFLAFQYSTRS